MKPFIIFLMLFTNFVYSSKVKTLSPNPKFESKNTTVGDMQQDLYKQIVKKYGESFAKSLLSTERSQKARMKTLEDIKVGNCLKKFSTLPIIPVEMIQLNILSHSSQSITHCVKAAALMSARLQKGKEADRLIHFFKVNQAYLPPPFIKKAPKEFTELMKSIRQFSNSWKFHFTEKFEQFSEEPIVLFETFMSYIPKDSKIKVGNYLIIFMITQILVYWQHKTFWETMVNSLENSANKMSSEKCTVLFLEFESLLASIRVRMLQSYLIVPFIEKKPLTDAFLNPFAGFLFVQVYDLKRMKQGLIYWGRMIDEFKNIHKGHYKFLLTLTDYFKEVLYFFNSYIVPLVPISEMNSFIAEGRHTFLYRRPEYIIGISERWMSEHTFSTDIYDPFIITLDSVLKDFMNRNYSVDSWEKCASLCEAYPEFYSSFQTVAKELYNLIVQKAETVNVNQNVNKLINFSLGCFDIRNEVDYVKCLFSIPKPAMKIFALGSTRSPVSTSTSSSTKESRQSRKKKKAKLTKSDESKILSAKEENGEVNSLLETQNEEIPLVSDNVSNDLQINSSQTLHLDSTNDITNALIENDSSLDDEKERIVDEINQSEDAELDEIGRMMRESIESAKNYKKRTLFSNVLTPTQIRDNLYRENDKIKICQNTPQSRAYFYISEYDVVENEKIVFSPEQFATLCSIFFPSHQGLAWRDFLKVMSGLRASLDNQYGSVYVFRFFDNSKLRVDKPHKPGKEAQTLSPWNLRFIRKFLFNMLSMHPFYFSTDQQ